MSKESAKQFLTDFREKTPDAELKKKIMDAGSEEECLHLFAETAVSMGYDVSEPELREAMDALDAERRAKTVTAVEDMQSLEDDDLKDVAGGVYYITQKCSNGFENETEQGCRFDFTDENCRLQDACESFYIDYYGCTEKYLKECTMIN